MSDSSLPDFENPPLTEVVCGISYKPIEKLTAAHIGVLWGMFQPDYPKVEEHPPIPLAIELFEPRIITEPEIEFTSFAPLPREMFISSDDIFVIQIQRDRFVFNWRKLTDKDSYPRYPLVIAKFEENLAVFEGLLEQSDFEAEPIQYELTYTNHIPIGDLWQDTGDIGGIFPFITPSIDGNILRRPEHVNLKLTFVLPDKVGRLHATIRSNAIRRSDNKPMIAFEMTVRGPGTGHSKEGRRAWFDLARTWIVKGFTDLTSSEAHETLWGRIK